MKTILATEVQIGDKISVNTGYRPLDDEICEVLKIENKIGLFGDKQISFYIKSYTGDHWFDVPIEMVYGENKFQTKINRCEKK